MLKIKIFISKLLASFFYTGYMRPAPGTWGTVAAAAVFYFLYEHIRVPLTDLMIIGGALFVIGVPASTMYEKLSNEKDSGTIVIDEAAAVWFGLSAVLFLKLVTGYNDWFLIITYVVCFRLFDIWKPWPIKLFENTLSSGLGVMFDDIIAAGYAAVLYVGVFWGLAQF